MNRMRTFVCKSYDKSIHRGRRGRGKRERRGRGVEESTHHTSYCSIYFIRMSHVFAGLLSGLTVLSFVFPTESIHIAFGVSFKC